MIFKQETIKSWFTGVGNSINNEVVKPFKNANNIICEYNLAIQHNSLTQQGWQRLLAQSNDSLKAYLTSIKGTTASMSGYNVSLQGSITGFTKITKAIKQYNTLGATSQKEQQAFTTAVSATNTKLGTYLTGLNGANASLSGYGLSLITSTAKTVGLTMATSALNATLTMGICLIVSGLISAFVSWIHKSEEITEKAQEAADRINSINDSLKSNTETVENAKKRYAELAQEVENLGKITQSQGTLSNEEYEEFLNLSNQLAGIFPSLTKNYDENGNAILDLSGDVKTIVGSLDSLIQKEKELANQKIMEEFPDVFKGWNQDLSDAEQKVKSAKTEFDKINQAYSSLGNGLSIQMGFLPTGYNKEGTMSIGRYEGWLKDLGLAYEETVVSGGKVVTAIGDINTAFTSKLEKAREDLQYAQQQLEGQTSSINQYLNTWLQTEFSYNLIEDSGLQTAIQDMLFNFDWSSLPEGIDKNDWDAVSEYLRRNILFSINNIDNSDILNALANIYSGGLNSGELLDAIAKVQEYFGSEHPISISLQAKVDDTQPLINNVKEKLQDDFDDKVGELTLEELKIAAEQIEVPEGTLLSWDELKDKIKEVQNSTSEISPVSFPDALKDSEDIQSTISTLRSALDAFNQGTLDESAVLDLMQQFPALIPYVDLATDGFGNLSEGLSTLMEQEPDSLIQKLQTLKQSLETDQEREQVDLLINSLQQLSSYGDTGIEAYNTSISSTWNDTANVIENVTSQFENLAKVQEAVANGLTMSASAAAELAKMYPEILTNAEVSANGQITLNEDVVNGILDGDSSIIGAQIAKLEADKAELTAKKSYAEAQLNIVKQVAEGEGNITKEVAQYRLDIANQLLQSLIEAGMEEDRAYAAVAANMAGNMDEYNRIVGEVAQDTSVNMDDAAVSMANSININSINSQTSIEYLQKKVQDLADSIKAAANGEKAGSSGIYGGGGSTSTGGIKAQKHTGSFNTAITDYTPETINLKDFQSQLEVDIKDYTDAISNIDSQIEILKNLQASFESNGGIGGHGYKDKISQLEKEKDALNKASKDSAGSAQDTFNKTINFFEQRVKVLQNAFESLEKGMENVLGADAKNALATAQSGIVEEEINNYTDALAMYRQKANDALSGMDSDLREKVVNGAVQISDFMGKGNEEVVEAISNYQGWADKVADCTQKLEELKTQIRQLELQKFHNIMEEFKDQFDLRDDSMELIQKQIGLLEEAGELIGESFYSKQMEQSQKQLDLLDSEKARLVQQLNDAISSGRVQHGTDEWLEMQNALSEVEGDILDCKTAMEEFSNELLNLNWQIFERVQTEFGNISSELGNLADLFDDFNEIRVSDGEGTWTNQAMASLGLYAQQLELAKYQVGQYGNAIDQLNKDYLAGKYSAAEYMDKLADLSQGQWDAVKSAEGLEDAIFDLNKTRVEEEIEVVEQAIEAYKEYTDAQIEALDAAKDLHDYQKEIADKTKSVSDLERQIAAMQHDDSAAAIAKRRKLEEDLAKAKEDLAEAEYAHSIESQKEALSKNYEDFESARNVEIEAFKASLENRELLISDSLETVKANAGLIGQEIANIAAEHGVIVSDAIISSWRSGEDAIASYGALLTEQSSAFIGNLIGVQSFVYGLQAQANTAAESLAWMFSTRADNLVQQLTSSFYSEANLNAMTNTLQNSLINTLERGYNINGITSALSSIASGADAVASAANRAASALRNMGAQQNNTDHGYRVYDSNSPSSNPKLLDTVYGSYSDLLKKYDNSARGIRVERFAKGGIVSNRKDSPFDEIAKTIGENKLIAVNPGEGVLTAEQVKAMREFTPAVESMSRPGNLSGIGSSFLPEAVSVKQRPNVTLHYDKLININGDVNDTNHFTKQIGAVAETCINKTFQELSRDLRYGR